MSALISGSLAKYIFSVLLQSLDSSLRRNILRQTVFQRLEPCFGMLIVLMGQQYLLFYSSWLLFADASATAIEDNEANGHLDQKKLRYLIAGAICQNDR